MQYYTHCIITNITRMMIMTMTTTSTTTVTAAATAESIAIIPGIIVTTELKLPLLNLAYYFNDTTTKHIHVTH